MTEGISATGVGGSFFRGVASIPSRRSLNVQLGPTATAADGEEDYLQQLERQYSKAVGWTASEPPVTSTHRSTPRQRSLRQQQQQQQQQQQRVPWSRMVASSAALPATSQPPTGAAAAVAVAPPSSSTSASLCQFVDFGETRELIRRNREAAKRLAEVNSIVTHLSLEKENSQEQQHDRIGWGTFRRQPNSQFKQYVFQSPGRTPLLPSTAGPQNPDQLQQPHLQRSQTVFALVAGRTAARHSRPEPLGAAFRRERTTVDSTGVTASELHREASNLASSTAASHRQSSVVQANFRAQGHSSNATSVPDSLDNFYGQFQRRKMKSFRLD